MHCCNYSQEFLSRGKLSWMQHASLIRNFQKGTKKVKSCSNLHCLNNCVPFVFLLHLMKDETTFFERYRLFRNFMSNKLYNWACILMNILQAKKYKTQILWISIENTLSEQLEKWQSNFLAITDATMEIKELNWEELWNSSTCRKHVEENKTSVWFLALKHKRYFMYITFYRIL